MTARIHRNIHQAWIIFANISVVIDRRELGREAHPIYGNHRLTRHLDQDRRFAAQSKAAQFNYPRGEYRRNARINCVAAFLQDSQSCLRNQRMPGGNHSAFSHHQGF